MTGEPKLSLRNQRVTIYKNVSEGCELTVEGLFGVVTGVDGDDDDARVRAEAGRSSSACLVAVRDLAGHPTFLVRHCLLRRQRAACSRSFRWICRRFLGHGGQSASCTGLY